MKSKNTIKKFISTILSLIVTVGALSATAISIYAESEKTSVLYLEVSNTLTAQDTFAWDTYDHINYKEPYYSQLNLQKHIVFDGDNIKMMGYGEVAYKDFLLVEDDNNTRKILSFDIQRDQTDWHSMEGGGFLFNASVENNNLQGYCALITQYGLRLYQIPSVNVNTFRNSTYKTISSYSKLLETCPIGNVKAEHHIKIEASQKYVSIWDGDNIVIDKFELPENNYGFGYGPITSHESHSCRQQSYFTFSNIKMETVTGYYTKLDRADDEWGLTDDYWANTFILETIEYTPEENETIKDFSEHPMFRNAIDMVLFYPDGTYEHIPWSNGEADYDNVQRYINVLESNVEAGTIELQPGEKIIGAYAE